MVGDPGVDPEHAGEIIYLIGLGNAWDQLFNLIELTSKYSTSKHYTKILVLHLDTILFGIL